MSPAMHTVCSIAYHISFIIMAAESQNEMNAVSDQPLAKINLINKYKSIVSFLNQLPLLNLGTYSVANRFSAINPQEKEGWKKQFKVKVKKDSGEFSVHTTLLQHKG
jgi:hypothetical protein